MFQIQCVLPLIIENSIRRAKQICLYRFSDNLFMIDLLSHHFPESTQKNCLDHGFVRFVDSMPRIVDDEAVPTADSAIVQAARVSYAAGTKSVNEDRGLIRYLMRHRHSTPFEMIEFKFHCSMPIFIARQWIRHRTANVNEMSGRYSILPDKFYYPSPDGVRAQSKTNKQGTEGQIDSGDATWFCDKLEESSTEAYKQYEAAIDRGVGREQARMLLPVNLYTEWYWKIDLHNLLHFLSLRCDSHAQYEIRVFADAMLEMITPLVPFTVEAWNDYHPYRGAVTLSRLEWAKMQDAIQHLKVNSSPVLSKYDSSLNSGNKREDAEWQDKVAKLGI